MTKTPRTATKTRNSLKAPKSGASKTGGNAASQASPAAAKQKKGKVAAAKASAAKPKENKRQEKLAALIEKLGEESQKFLAASGAFLLRLDHFTGGPLTKELTVRYRTAWYLSEVEREVNNGLLNRAEKVLGLARNNDRLEKKLQLMQLANQLIHEHEVDYASRFQEGEVSAEEGQQAFQALVLDALRTTLPLSLKLDRIGEFEARLDVAVETAMKAVETWDPREGRSLNAWARVQLMPVVHDMTRANQASRTHTTAHLQEAVAEVLRYKRQLEDQAIQMGYMNFVVTIDDILNVVRIRSESKMRTIFSEKVLREAWDTLHRGGDQSIEERAEKGAQVSGETREEEGEGYSNAEAIEDQILEEQQNSLTMVAFEKSSSSNALGNMLWATPNWELIARLHRAQQYDFLTEQLREELGRNCTANEEQGAELAIRMYMTREGIDTAWAATRPDRLDQYEAGDIGTYFEGVTRRVKLQKEKLSAEREPLLKALGANAAD